MGKKTIYDEPQMKFNIGLQKYEVDLPQKTKLKHEIESSQDKTLRLSVIFCMILVFILILIFFIVKKWLF